MRAAATAVLILLFVQGCVFPVGYCTRSEAPEVTQEQSTRDDVVAVLGEPYGTTVLGEPYGTTEVYGHSIDVYDYDVFCAGVYFVGIPIPQWRDRPGVVVVEYKDDVVVRADIWWEKEPRDVIKWHEDRAARLAKAKKVARDGDPEAMWSYAYALDDPKKAWVWFCRAANEGLPIAQYHLGNSYHHGKEPVVQDSVQSYLWYTLAGSKREHRVFRNLIAEMTPDQIIEAERPLAEWEPNPAKCEIIRVQAEH
jgi:hypothetical protein